MIRYQLQMAVTGSQDFAWAFGCGYDPSWVRCYLWTG